MRISSIVSANELYVISAGISYKNETVWVSSDEHELSLVNHVRQFAGTTRKYYQKFLISRGFLNALKV